MKNNLMIWRCGNVMMTLLFVTLSLPKGNAQINYREPIEANDRIIDSLKKVIDNKTAYLKIRRVKTTDEGNTVFWFKDVITNHRYITICDCRESIYKYKKGNIIPVPKSKLIVLREVFRKRDLEN